MYALVVVTFAAAILLGAAPVGRQPETARLVAAGDVAACNSGGDEATALLLDRLPGAVAVLGDSVYERGTDEEYARCYTPSWGRHRARTRPAVGNHEYGTPDAGGYFRYFGSRAGPARGFYAYDLGSWRVLVLNTNCTPAGGCTRGSPQERWLRSELARHRRSCTLVYGHHPRFSSGLHGSDASLAALWRTLVAGGADLSLAGHDHHYERFAPLDGRGRVDLVRGVRHFVVGTGGRSHYPVLRRLRASRAVDARTHGVLALELRAGDYAWRFEPVEGAHFRDAGSGRCHP